VPKVVRKPCQVFKRQENACPPLIAHSTWFIEAYRNEHGNGGYVGGGSDPGLLRAATVCIGEHAEVIADRARSAVANPLEPDAI
jgi:hypothetical protein